MVPVWIRPDPASQSGLRWALWHVLAALSLAALVSAISTAAISLDSFGPLAVVLVAYLVLSLAALAVAALPPVSRFAGLALCTLVLFGAGYAALRLGLFAVSSRVLAAACLLALAAAVVPFLQWRARVAVVAGLLLAIVVAAWVQRPKSKPVAPAPGVIGTSLHSLSIQRHAALIARPAADGGAIESVGSHLLLATGEGQFHWLARPAPAAGWVARPLQIRAPADRAAYLAAFSDPALAPRLRLTDIAVEPQARPARLYAAHQAWDSRRRCYTMRVSRVDLAWAADGLPMAGSDWRTLFDSQPCLAASETFDDSETGGKLAWAPDGGLLLTPGDNGFSGLAGSPPFAQRGDVDYGKILRLDVTTGAATVVSTGHRNPQGLVVDHSGQIWSSEHGPKGGDEINLIEQGANYGWPAATYGTSYGTRTWPLDRDGRDHAGFHEPALAFVPGIAPSSLIEVQGDELPRWRGDLLLASLGSQSLYRIRLRGERVVYVEPIPMGLRMRDLAQTDDGRIFIWSDAGVVVEMSRSDADSAFSLNCAGCHAPAVGAAAGPSLSGVVGRDIASLPGFAYSATLAGRDGVWTEAALDAFLRDPAGFAPGTTMKMPGLDDATRAEVISLLKGQGG